LKDETGRYGAISCLSVFQWLYLQNDSSAVDEALAKFFGIADKLTFFEMGYTSEKHYVGRLREQIDRAWVMGRMKSSGCFSEIRLYEEGTHGLKRDFFVGIRGL